VVDADIDGTWLIGDFVDFSVDPAPSTARKPTRPKPPRSLKSSRPSTKSNLTIPRMTTVSTRTYQPVPPRIPTQ
jgi:hypothetical protein